VRDEKANEYDVRWGEIDLCLSLEKKEGTAGGMVEEEGRKRGSASLSNISIETMTANLGID